MPIILDQKVVVANPDDPMIGYVTKALKSCSQRRITEMAKEIERQGRIVYGHQIRPDGNDRKIYYLDGTRAKLHPIGHLDFHNLVLVNRFERQKRVQSIFEHAASLICAGQIPA